MDQGEVKEIVEFIDWFRCGIVSGDVQVREEYLLKCPLRLNKSDPTVLDRLFYLIYELDGLARTE